MMAAVPRIRAFIALKTSPAWDAWLQEVQGGLRNALRGAGEFRWVDPAQFHLTLRFLGSISEDEAGQVASILASEAEAVGRFELRWSGLGCFPRPDNPRVLWAGLSAGPALLELHQKLSLRTAGFGEPPDSRPFHPHLTLARVARFERSEASRLEALLQASSSGPRPEPWPVRQVLLIRSHLSCRGARYETLSAHDLRTVPDR